MNIEEIIRGKIDILNSIQNDGYVDNVIAVSKLMEDSIKEGNKIITAGNGGSAADAQHFSGEIVGRFLKERGALASVSICVDPCVMTAIGNDYGYNNVFARQIEGIGRSGDVFLAISTSGNSQNIIDAVNVCKQKGIKTVLLSGKDGGKLKNICDYSLIVPSNETPRIQEIHTFTVHLLCEMIEKDLYV